MAGVFLGLALIKDSWTGPVGEQIGVVLWSWLGAGAVGLPLHGLAIALAGFDRLPRLDMKRAAILMGGVSLLVPFFAAVVAGVSEDAMRGSVWEWPLAARLSGILPGLLAKGTVSAVGTVGGLLVGFLALSGLTLGTLAWHPLRRLERPQEAVPESAPAPRARRTAPAVVEAEEEGGSAPSSPRSACRSTSGPRRSRPSSPASPRACWGSSACSRGGSPRATPRASTT